MRDEDIKKVSNKVGQFYWAVYKVDENPVILKQPKHNKNVWILRWLVLHLCFTWSSLWRYIVSIFVKSTSWGEIA